MTRLTARFVLTLVGAAGLAASAVAAEIAWLHMRWLAATYGVICGAGGVPHCAACPAAMALLAAGLAALTGAAGMSRVPAKAALSAKGDDAG